VSKKVVWGEGKFQSAARPAGSYSSFREFLAKSEKLRLEQEEATKYLSKALPAMVKLLEIRFSNGEALKVMRPLRYQTSVLKSEMEDELDRSFYKSDGNRADSFVDTIKVINPGSLLMLKSLDPQMREFILVDGLGKEHCVSFDDRNALLTQTDIFETVKNLFEQGELKNV
jgi:hypothetical protein